MQPIKSTDGHLKLEVPLYGHPECSEWTCKACFRASNAFSVKMKVWRICPSRLLPHQKMEEHLLPPTPELPKNLPDQGKLEIIL
mmetsp:Transcript_10991/g.67952  ORF Transcript_10991/g.67952 Transcript_10991/m.67952 type:complete len:84 (-) Transcript_10991:732-983(-)